MKKRALILAMIAFIAATTSEPSINMVRAEETQVEETQTEENAGQTSELPIKTLTPKVMDVNPYMAASDSNIHHDCYNTDSTDEVLPVDIYSEINVSYEKVNPNASPAVFFDSYGHAVVPVMMWSVVSGRIFPMRILLWLMIMTGQSDSSSGRALIIWVSLLLIVRIPGPATAPFSVS